MGCGEAEPRGKSEVVKGANACLVREIVERKACMCREYEKRRHITQLIDRWCIRCCDAQEARYKSRYLAFYCIEINYLLFLKISFLACIIPPKLQTL